MRLVRGIMRQSEMGGKKNERKRFGEGSQTERR